MGETKRLIYTAIVVGLVAIITGLFLGGGLLPSQPAQQQYDKRIISGETVRIQGHSHDGLRPHEHRITTVVTSTETTTHGWFHNFGAATISGANMGVATSPGGPGDNEVWLAAREFRPSVITVTVGTTVTWVHKDSELHTVTSTTGLFGGTLFRDDTLNYTFAEPGTFSYYCEPHEGMKGTVIVK